MGLFGNKDPEDQEEIEEEELETYNAKGTCDNCGAAFVCNIPKGTTVSEHTQDIICEKCGCNIDQLTCDKGDDEK